MFFLSCIKNFQRCLMTNTAREVSFVPINEFHSTSDSTSGALQTLRDVLIQSTAPPRLQVEWLEVLQEWARLIDVIAVGAR